MQILSINIISKCGKMQNWSHSYFVLLRAFDIEAGMIRLDAICCCRRYNEHFKQMGLRSHFLHWAITCIFINFTIKYFEQWCSSRKSVVEHLHSKLKRPLMSVKTLYFVSYCQCCWNVFPEFVQLSYIQDFLRNSGFQCHVTLLDLRLFTQ